MNIRDADKFTGWRMLAEAELHTKHLRGTGDEDACSHYSSTHTSLTFCQTQKHQMYWISAFTERTSASSQNRIDKKEIIFWAIQNTCGKVIKFKSEKIFQIKQIYLLWHWSKVIGIKYIVNAWKYKKREIK